MSAPVYRCIQCRTSLTPQVYKQKIWHQCRKCFSGFVPIEFFTAILSEYEFNKLGYSIKRGQIKSSRKCPVCLTQMNMSMDVAGQNQVEACSSCRLVWLDPNEGVKIKADQDALKNSEGKIKLPSNLRPELMDRLELEVAEDETVHPIDKILYPQYPTDYLYRRRRRIGIFTVAPALTEYFVKLFRLEKLSARYPTVAFFLAMIILIIAIKLIWTYFPHGIRRYHLYSWRRFLWN